VWAAATVRNGGGGAWRGARRGAACRRGLGAGGSGIAARGQPPAGAEVLLAGGWSGDWAGVGRQRVLAQLVPHAGEIALHLLGRLLGQVRMNPHTTNGGRRPKRVGSEG